MTGRSGLVGVASWRSNVGGKGDGVDGARRPANPRPHRQTVFIRFIFQNLGERSLQSAGAQFGGPLQNFPKVAGLHGGAAELAKQRLLPQSIAELVPANAGLREIVRFPIGFENVLACGFSEHGLRPAMNSETFQCVSAEVWLLFSEESEQNGSPQEFHRPCGRRGLRFVVWTTDSKQRRRATNHLLLGGAAPCLLRTTIASASLSACGWPPTSCNSPPIPSTRF